MMIGGKALVPSGWEITSAQLCGPDGSSSVPTYSFCSDTGSGLYLSESGVVGLAGDLLINSGKITQNFTATENDVDALEIDVDAAGFGDVKALDIVYITGSLAAGEEEAIILINVDESGGSGGDVVALEVLATEGSVGVYALEAGAGVNPIKHQSGSFANMDSALVNATDRLTEFTSTGSDIQMFVANGDTVTIGSANKFEEIEFLLAIVASNPGIKPTFGFSDGLAGFTSFSPVDGTNGMRNSGIIAWDDADIGAWAKDGGEFLIKITRTAAASITPPTEDLVQIAAVTQFFWDKNADLTFNSFVAGHASALSTGGVTAGAQILGTAAADSALSIGRWSADAAAPSIRFYKSRHATIGSLDDVVTGDELGNIIAHGDDGTDDDTISSAIIFGTEGTISTGQVPGIIRFQVAAAGTLADALTISSAKLAAFAGAVTMAATLTISRGSNEHLILNHTGATGNPFLSFKQDGTRRSFIQHADSGDNLTIISEYGGIILKTGTGGTEVTAITVDASQNTILAGSLDISCPNTVSGTGLMVTTNDTSVQEVMRDSSSLRWKTDPKEAEIDVRSVLGIKPKTYGRSGSDDRYLGFIVEDFHDAGFRDIIAYDKEGPAGFLDFGRGITALHQAVLRSHDERIELLEDQMRGALA